MLILTRKMGEVITIGDDIKVIVLDIKGRHVRVGVEAPRQTKVYREEIYQMIKDQNQASSQSHFNHIDDILTNFKGIIKST